MRLTSMGLMGMRIDNVKRQTEESVKRSFIRVLFNETLSIGNNVWNAYMLFRVVISVCPRINSLGVGMGKHFWYEPWNPFVHSL